MAETTYSTSTDPIARVVSGAPRIAGTAVVFPPNRYNQDEVARELTSFTDPEFMRFARTTGVDQRSLALPLQRYPKLTGFTEANTAYIEVAVELGGRAVLSALDAAGIAPEEVDAIVMVSSTGVAVPTIDARFAPHIGLRPDVKRVPLFGLGCLAGTAGMARINDYLRAFPGHVAVLLSVELCSLTLQRDDISIPALIGVSLFGDGAAAVVVTGADRAPVGPSAQRGPRILASRSQLLPATADMMGWDVSSDGLGLVLSKDVPKMVDIYLGEDVTRFLAEYGLSSADVSTWICHPGGPKVLDSIENAIGLPPKALANSRNSMRENGNMSSVSVLDVLRRTIADSPPQGAFGVMVSMGPGFSFELVLLRW
jgi:predicted naringenin-chalcone synthase